MSDAERQRRARKKKAKQKKQEQSALAKRKREEVDLSTCRGLSEEADLIEWWLINRARLWPAEARPGFSILLRRLADDIEWRLSPLAEIRERIDADAMVRALEIDAEELDAEVAWAAVQGMQSRQDRS